jgi:hypothetical protein
MGIDTNSARFLMLCGKSGVNFTRMGTLGRQNLNVSPNDMLKAAEATGWPADSILDAFDKTSTFAEPFYRFLGAQSVETLDNSDFEGATTVLDLNEPIPHAMRERFSCLFDGGTLEHVFDFPTAIKNCMDMVELGGHFISVTTANNYLGHGFYQFSPELFFRVLTPANGFQTEAVLLYESSSRGRAAVAYWVHDPAKVGKRVLLTNAHQTLIMVRARKIGEVPAGRLKAMQSDYSAAWSDGPAQAEGPRLKPDKWNKRLRVALREIVPGITDGFYLRKNALSKGRFASDCYREVKLDASLLKDLQQ